MTKPRASLQAPAASAYARRLRRDEFLHFARPQRLCLRAERGTLWITVDGDPTDIEVPAGTSRVFDGGAALTVGVFGRSAALSVTRLGSERRRLHFGRLAQWLGLGTAEAAA